MKVVTKKIISVLVLSFVIYVLKAQEQLNIYIAHFGNVKIFSLHTLDNLEYKLKGDFLYRTDKIADMQDSTIVFATGEEIRLNQIKKIRLRKHIHLLTTIQYFFAGLGFGFFPLNTLNNLITDKRPLLDDRAALVSGGLLAVSFLLREFGIKRVRINNHHYLKVVELNFQQFNSR